MAGGHFDRECFDHEMTDKDVRNALRANRRIRIRQPQPKRQKSPVFLIVATPLPKLSLHIE